MGINQLWEIIDYQKNQMFRTNLKNYIFEKKSNFLDQI